jgi:hypothetical protein
VASALCPLFYVWIQARKSGLTSSEVIKSFCRPENDRAATILRASRGDAAAAPQPDCSTAAAWQFGRQMNPFQTFFAVTPLA